MPDLLDYLRSAYAPDSKVSYDKVFDAVRPAPLLVLDDLGAHSTTPWAQEKLFQLLNLRYNAALPTVITSNLALEEQDPRIQSRMLDRACATSGVGVPPYFLELGGPAIRRSSAAQRSFTQSDAPAASAEPERQLPPPLRRARQLVRLPVTMCASRVRWRCTMPIFSPHDAEMTYASCWPSRSARCWAGSASAPGGPAGLRTFMMVTAGSAGYTLVSIYGFVDLGTVRDPARVAAQIVTGIGFLGAGTIWRTPSTVRGLTTAATIWFAAAVGMMAGAGLYLLATGHGRVRLRLPAVAALPSTARGDARRALDHGPAMRR